MTKKEANQLSNLIHILSKKEDKIKRRLFYVDPFDQTELEFTDFRYDVSSDTYSFELKEGIEDSLWIEEEEIDTNCITLLQQTDWREYAKSQPNSFISG